MDRTKTAVDVFDRNALKYRDKFMDVSQYADVLDLFCAQLQKQDAHVLELACGPGNLTRYLLDKMPGLKILATDLAPKMLALAKEINSSANFMRLDCRDMNTLSDRYDGIVNGFGLPYLNKKEATEFINDAANVLVPGGVLYMSTMEDEYSKSGWQTSSAGERIYINYHEAGYLLKALKDNGFKLIDLQRKTYKPDGQTEMTDLVIVAKK
jgi:cyclopropane fatty-acyl-phospholipid synthase-like methyltransferase